LEDFREMQRSHPSFAKLLGTGPGRIRAFCAAFEALKMEGLTS
jgi:hypothetical protein